MIAWKPFLIILFAYYLQPFMVYAFFLYPIIIIVGFLQWKRMGLEFFDESISHSYFGWLFTTKMITLKKYVQHTGTSQSFINQKRSISTYSYSIHTDSLWEDYNFYGLDDDKKEMFLNYLRK